jgi:hypothetical protein
MIGGEGQINKKEREHQHHYEGDNKANMSEEVGTGTGTQFSHVVKIEERSDQLAVAVSSTLSKINLENEQRTAYCYCQLIAIYTRPASF